METADIPKLGTITRDNGIAGQYSYSTTVTYPGELPAGVTFVGNVYGGPIVMVTSGNPHGVWVSADVLDRIGGKLTPEWVRAFFA